MKFFKTGVCACAALVMFAAESAVEVGQVITASTGTPSPAEIKDALHRAGFTGPRADSWASAGNWIIKELK